MSSYELSEWMAYYNIEPFGDERADLRAGIIASTIVNVHSEKGKRATVPADFMAFKEQRTKDTSAKSPDDLRAKFDALTGG